MGFCRRKPGRDSGFDPIFLVCSRVDSIFSALRVFNGTSPIFRFALREIRFAARVVAERTRARYHYLKLPIYGFAERRLEGGGERWPQRQLSFRRFALAVNRTCMAEGEETGFPAIRTHSGETDSAKR
jgi:hypothetical protein